MLLKNVIWIVIGLFISEVTNAQNGNAALFPEISATDRGVNKFFEWVQKSEYASYPDEFQSRLKKYQWDDWIYYKVVQSAVATFFPLQSQNFQTLFCWYVLGKSGFDVRLTFVGEKIYLLAYTNDKVGGVSKLQIGHKIFVSLTTLEALNTSTLIKSNIIQNPQGKALSFSITKAPELPGVDSASFNFFELGFFDKAKNFFVFKVRVNDALVQMLETYPNLEWEKLVSTPLSSVASSSLIPQLKDLLEGRKPEEKVDLIYHFVRGGFNYLEDQDPDSHGREKWTIPEEALASPYLDCNDKLVLFYYLIKELMDVPLVLLKYSDVGHFAVGVSLDSFGVNGSLKHKDRSFLVWGTCNLENDLEKDAENNKNSFQIIVEYFPSPKK